MGSIMVKSCLIILALFLFTQPSEAFDLSRSVKLTGATPVDPSATTCPQESNFWLEWAKQVSGNSCQEKATAIISLPISHNEMIEQMKPVCNDCFFNSNNTQAVYYQKVLQSQRSTPVDNNAAALTKILTQMKNGPTVQALTLSDESRVAKELAVDYTLAADNKERTNDIAHLNRSLTVTTGAAASIGVGILSATSTRAVNSTSTKVETKEFDPHSLSQEVPGSCKSKLQFFVYQQVPPDNSDFYPFLKANKKYEPNDWNFVKLLQEFNQRTSNGLSLRDALKGHDEESKAIQSLKARLDFLKKNPLYLNLFSSSEPAMAPHQKELFDQIQQSFNNSQCAKSRDHRDCVLDKVADKQGKIKDIFSRKDVKEVVKTQAGLGISSLTRRMTESAEAMKIPVVTAGDLRVLATESISKVERRVAICDNVNLSKPNAATPSWQTSPAFMELQSDWAENLDLDDMNENEAFQDFNKKFCLDLRQNSQGHMINAKDYLASKCPTPNSCTHEQKLNHYDTFARQYRSLNPEAGVSDEVVSSSKFDKRYRVAALSDTDYQEVKRVSAYESPSYSSAGVSTPVVDNYSAATASSSASDFRASASAESAPAPADVPLPNLLPPAEVFPGSMMPAFANPQSQNDFARTELHDQNQKATEETKAAIKDTESAIESTDKKESQKVADLETQLAALRDQLKKLEQTKVAEPVVTPVTAQAPQAAAPVSSGIKAAVSQNSVSPNVAQATAAPSFASIGPSFSHSSFGEASTGAAKARAASGAMSGASLGKALGTASAASSPAGGASSANSIFVVNSPSAITVSGDSSAPAQDLAITVSTQEYQSLQGFRQGTTGQLDPKLIEKLQAQLGSIPTSKINLSFTAPDGQILKFDVTKGDNGLAFLPVDAAGRVPASVTEPAAPARQSKLYQNLLNTLDNSAR